MTTTATTATPLTISSHNPDSATSDNRNKITSNQNDDSYVPTGNTSAALTFFLPPSDGSVPYNYVEEPPANTPSSNYTVHDQEVTLHDIRGFESSFTLDNDAFQVLNATSSPAVDFNSDSSIREKYYPEVENLLLDNVPGAHKVIIFDHTLRKIGTKREPVNRTHVDQTPTSAAMRVRLHADPAEYESLIKGRYRIVNVWRPLNGPVQKNPLALASAKSVREEDLVPVEHRYPDRTGETAAVRYDPGQKWWYLSGMGNEERLLLKCADSWEVPGRRVPHSAFVDRRSPIGGKERESIEVRALVFG